jgi:hypothetical protein
MKRKPVFRGLDPEAWIALIAAVTFAALIWWASGCAVGYTRSDGSVVGAAVGHSEIRACRPVVAELATTEPRCEPSDRVELACAQVRGGYLSSGFAGVIEGALAGFGAWLMAGS